MEIRVCKSVACLRHAFASLAGTTFVRLRIHDFTDLRKNAYVPLSGCGIASLLPCSFPRKGLRGLAFLRFRCFSCSALQHVLCTSRIHPTSDSHASLVTAANREALPIEEALHEHNPKLRLGPLPKTKPPNSSSPARSVSRPTWTATPNCTSSSTANATTLAPQMLEVFMARDREFRKKRDSRKDSPPYAGNNSGTI